MVKWKDAYSVGYELFDQQHKELIDLINEIGELVKDNTVDHDSLYDEANEIIGKILNYTVYHFESEEEIFEKSGYALSQEHKDEHVIFVENVKVLVSDLNEDVDVKAVVLKIYETLVEWLIKHILNTDKKYMGTLNI